MESTTRSVEKLNTTWHKPALWIFMAIALAHVTEHGVQAVQVYALGWDVPDSRGVVGQWIPWLVRSEWMHYLYAIVTLAGLVLLMPGFAGRALTWWLVALVAQFWHHLEHGLLLLQRLTESPWFGEAVPTSLVQLLVPRVELHLFYNTVVLMPMLIAFAYHSFPTEAERVRAGCNCAWRRALRLAIR